MSNVLGKSTKNLKKSHQKDSQFCTKDFELSHTSPSMVAISNSAVLKLQYEQNEGEIDDLELDEKLVEPS